MNLSIPHSLRTSLFALGFTMLGASGAVSLQAQATDGPGYETTQQQAPGGKKARKQRGGGGMMGQLRMIVRDLDLSEDQLEMVKGISQAYRADRQAQRSDKMEDLDSLQALLEEDNVNRRAVHKLIDARLDAKAEAIHATTDQLLDFVETLDADQRVILNEKLIEMETRASERAQGKAAPRSPQSWGPPTTEGSAP